ncbi:hypothetical protein M9458_057241 [Cirrhinus mrigala]|uniref:ribonuclease H n=1 Tax=Cirrhinus mrigala TaxID=683832 RepID=A0ABD0MFL5_CIRMR
MLDLETLHDVNDHLSPSPPQLSKGELKQPSFKEAIESMELLVGMVERMGHSIGESIASSLESKVCGSSNADSSVLNRVLKSEIKEPVCFRGDRVEPYTIHEWEAIVLSYLRKIGTPIEEQADEVMSRLMGRAREAVRVGLRSNPSIVLCKGPSPIFDLLKQHFSDTAYSSMPLADFYGTLPHAGLHVEGVSVRPNDNPPSLFDYDLESVYKSICVEYSSECTVVLQNIQKLEPYDDLFYTVIIGGQVEVKAMLDTGSMACTMSSKILPQLLSTGVLSSLSLAPTDVVLVRCGGTRTKPLGMIELDMDVYGCHVIVPTIVVEGQGDDLILGINLLKHLIHQLRSSSELLISVSEREYDNTEQNKLLDLLANVEKWRNGTVPDLLGTVKIKTAVPLEPTTENLVWGKLQRTHDISAGSAVILDPSRVKSRPRSVLVGKTVALIRKDGWVPLKVINPSEKAVTLKRNSTLADAFPCMALQDFDCSEFPDACSFAIEQKVQRTADVLTDKQDEMSVTDALSLTKPGSNDSCAADDSTVLRDLGLTDLDVESCNVSADCKVKLVQLISQYHSVFSRHKLDSGKATGFVHRICLSDDKPFWLPYHRLAPTQYERLRQALDEMEEREIILKSSSEFASPLVLVWKKSGDLRICTDFRWINARTIKDAHPLPHQADALAVLGGNAYFSTMDLTSGYYNVEVHEDDFNPATFMRKMLTIFRDQNFISLLCYLDNVLVFAPTEELALEHLEMVFKRLKTHNLKLAPKKCHDLRSIVKFLGHIISADGIATDPEKVKAITSVTEDDLMIESTNVPSQQKIRSFLGMVVFYQQFIEDCSSIAKPLFNLTTGRKAPRGKWKRRACQRELSASDWTEECSQAFHKLKQALLDQVLLVHLNFNEAFLLSVDASTPYQFDIKYVPGPKNIVADALSQEPFVHPSILHRLTRVPYSELLAEVADVHTDHVQDVFRWSTHPFHSTPDTEGVAVACHTAKASLPGTLSIQEVEAVLHSCRHSDTIIRPHALLLPHLPQAIIPSESTDINVMSHDDLMKRQQEDIVLSRPNSLRGANFESALIAELLQVARVQKSRTTPYHPMGNGACERMNRTVGNMIRALPAKTKQKWPQVLKSLTFAYNCTIHETMRYAPFLLMFGRIPWLPVDLVFETVLDNPDVVDYDSYVQALRRDMKEAMHVAQASAREGTGGPGLGGAGTGGRSGGVGSGRRSGSGGLDRTSGDLGGLDRTSRDEEESNPYGSIVSLWHMWLAILEAVGSERGAAAG